MIYPDFLAALARERSAAFPAEAETARRARQGCPKATLHGGDEWTMIVAHSPPAG